MKKLVIFGASGATGRALVGQALAKGHEVTAFIRTPGKLDVRHDCLRLVQGDVKDQAAVERAVSGNEAVLSTLGVSTPLKHDPAVVQGVGHIVQAMERSGPARLIYLSFLGVRDGRHQLGFLLGNILAPLVLRNEVADHEAKEKLIQHSKLDWTIVRPPKMTGGPRTGIYRNGTDIRTRSIFPTIAREDVADFMLRQLDDHTNIRKTMTVMH